MKPFAAGILCILIVVALLVFWPATPQLVIRNQDSGDILLTRDAFAGMTFDVSYIHSVNKSRVYEHLILTENLQIMVTGTSFTAYGVGIPEPEEGQTITVGEDFIKIEHIDRILKSHLLFTGVTADHAIHFSETDIVHFSDLTAPQTPLEISIEKRRQINGI